MKRSKVTRAICLSLYLCQYINCQKLLGRDHYILQPRTGNEYFFRGTSMNDVPRCESQDFIIRPTAIDSFIAKTGRSQLTQSIFYFFGNSELS